LGYATPKRIASQRNTSIQNMRSALSARRILAGANLRSMT
jgi:hypothetical protein